MLVSSESQYLLLDTCIVEYWLDENINVPMTKLASRWGGQENRLLAVSEISYAELIRGAHKKKIDKVKNILSNYTSFEVSQRVLVGSGILTNIYSAQSRQTNGASVEDMIIATTSFIYNLPIITANVSDFPHPFFITELSENLIFRKGNKDRLITIAKLRPNTEILKYWYEQTK